MVHAARSQQGQQALASGDWTRALDLLEQAPESAETFDGLGRARWWLRDVAGAVDARSRAYREYRREGRDGEAAIVAVWLARELRTLFRNNAAADGWLQRAHTVTPDDHPAAGWISLALGEAAEKPEQARRHLQMALDSSRRHGDANLEVVALARVGLLRIAAGEVDAGTGQIDEAMAAASSGEADDAQSVCTTYCILMEAAELLADSARFEQWSSAITELRDGLGFGPLAELGSTSQNLSVYCGTCCGGMYLATRRLDEAELELKDAIAELETTGMASRCVHPVTRLAEIRILQGRLEEARRLLEPYEDLAESVRPLALLDLALGAPRPAVARLEARLEELHGMSVTALPLLTLLVDAQLAAGDGGSAARTAKELTVIATGTGSQRHIGEALLSSGKCAAAAGGGEAVGLLRQAARVLAAEGAALPACRARLELSRSLAESDRPVAISEARAALAAFDRLGAVADSNAAAAFLRELGVKGRTGPKTLEKLSERELQVLRLVAQGLSNPEIATRLFISTKTAGHHVSSILVKLEVRSRTEAAAFAAIHLGAEPAIK